MNTLMGVVPASVSPGANWEKHASVYNALNIFLSIYAYNVPKYNFICQYVTFKLN